MIKALDFTSKGDNDDVTITYDGGKQAKVKKKFLAPAELFETGVYNSETDTNTNPKTGENAPDKTGAVIDRLSERLKEIVNSLDELRLFVKDNSSISHETLDSCITDLTAYVQGLDEEGKETSTGTIN